MATYFERTWKAVKVNNNPASGSVGGVRNNVAALNWYKNLTELDAKWQKKLETYREMDRTTDIRRALDIMAEDISSENADDNRIFEVGFQEDTKTSQIKTIQKTLDTWEKKTELDYMFFDYARDMLKYGISLFEVASDGGLTKLRPDRLKGHELDPKDDSKVKYYLYDRKGSYKTDLGELVYQEGDRQSIELDKLDVKNLLILKIGEGPYGESVLEYVYRVWRQLILLEDAVVIYRIVRAPERRAFYIDVGKQPAHKAEAYVESVKNRMKQRQVQNKGTGKMETEYDPHTMQEDYFLGQSGEGRGSRIETLPGGDNLGRIEDLQYFNKKLALGLRIPVSYMDSYSEDSQGSVHNDGRVGTAYITELRYAGYIQRIQRKLSKTLFTNFRKFSKKFGTELPDDLEFGIAPPQSFAVYKQNELFSILLNTYSSAEGMDMFSKRESLKRFMQWEEDEIIENENARLIEMGLEEKTINKLPDHIKMNLVYGDGEIAREWLDESAEEEETPALPRNAGPEDSAGGGAESMPPEPPVEEEPPLPAETPEEETSQEE